MDKTTESLCGIQWVFLEPWGFHGISTGGLRADPVRHRPKGGVWSDGADAGDRFSLFWSLRSTWCPSLSEQGAFLAIRLRERLISILNPKWNFWVFLLRFLRWGSKWLKHNIKTPPGLGAEHLPATLARRGWQGPVPMKPGSHHWLLGYIPEWATRESLLGWCYLATY